MNDTMRKNIAASDYIFIIATPRLKERAEESGNNNLKFELNHIFTTKQHILPLIWEGNFNSSIPITPNYPFDQYYCYDFSKHDYYTYFKLLIGTTNPKGIIPTILPLDNVNQYKILVNKILGTSST